MSFNDLPDELLLIIVGKLDYHDIKRCMRVSKRLNIITKDRSFDRKLFRERDVVPPGGDFNIEELELHPLLDDVDCTNTKVEDCYVRTEDDWEDWKVITEYPVAEKEYATSPPVNQFRLRVGNFPTMVFKRKDGSGFTALTLVDAVCRFFDTANTYGILYKDACPWIFDKSSQDPEWKPPEDRTAKWIELMGRRNGWTGFNYIGQDHDGCLFLEALSFDSWYTIM